MTEPQLKLLSKLPIDGSWWTGSTRADSPVLGQLHGSLIEQEWDRKRGKSKWRLSDRGREVLNR